MEAVINLPDPELFSKRARKVVSNAGLYQLVQDMADHLIEQNRKLDAIHAMCTTLLERSAT
jgi:hypothetical protein